MNKKSYFSVFLNDDDINNALESFDGSKISTLELLEAIGTVCSIQDSYDEFTDTSIEANCSFFKFLYDNGVDIFKYPELWDEYQYDSDWPSYIPQSVDECIYYASDAVFK